MVLYILFGSILYKVMYYTDLFSGFLLHQCIDIVSFCLPCSSASRRGISNGCMGKQRWCGERQHTKMVERGIGQRLDGDKITANVIAFDLNILFRH